MFAQIQAWAPFGVVAGFTGRAGGVSDPPYDRMNLGLHVGDEAARVLENRRRLAGQLGVQETDFVYAKQVHSERVAFVTAAERGRGAHTFDSALEAVDGLVTGDAGVVLMALAADCVPVLFAGFAAGVVGAAHAGWRGATSGVVTAAVSLLGEKGAWPGELDVAIGPAIRACCYEVDEPVLAAASAAYARFGGDMPEPARSPRHAERYMLDIPRLIKDELQALGVAPGRILDAGVCTHCQPGYFSHRRDGGRTGRQAAFIYLKEGRGHGR